MNIGLEKLGVKVGMQQPRYALIWTLLFFVGLEISWGQSGVPQLKIDRSNRWRDFAVVHYGTTEGLNTNAVEDVFKAPTGILWIATQAGIHRFDGRTMVHVGPENLPYGHYHGLCLFNDSILLPFQFGETPKTFINIKDIKLKDNRLRKYGERAVFSRQSDWCYPKDSLLKSSLMAVIGPQHYLLKSLESRRYYWVHERRVWTVPYEVPPFRERSFFVHDGLAYGVDTLGILWELRWTQKRAIGRLPIGDFQMICRRHQRTPFVYQNESLYRLTTKDGVWVLEHLLEGFKVKDLTSVVDDSKYGMMLLSSRKEGLVMVRQKSIRPTGLVQYGFEEMGKWRPSRGARLLEEWTDSATRFRPHAQPEIDFTHQVFKQDSLCVFTTNNGLFLVQDQDMERCLGGDTLIQVYRFTAADGLEYPEFDGKTNPGGVALPGERLAFSGVAGFYVWYRNDFHFPYRADSVYLEQFRPKGASFSMDGGIMEIEPEFKEISIRLLYPYLGLENNNAILYYRIPQLNEAWQVYNFEMGLHLNPLRFGDYQLEVWAPAIHREAQVIQRFRVMPPFYRQAWFWLAVSFILSSIVILMVRRRVQQFKSRQEELERLLKSPSQDIALVNAQLRRSLDIRNKMVSILSHDIKGPARFLGDIVALIRSKMDAANAPLWESEMTYLERGVQNFNDRIHTILSWVRFDFQSCTSAQLWCDPREIWQQCVLEHEVFAQRSDLEIIDRRPELKNDWPQLKCESGSFQVILNNLFSNSLKHARSQLMWQIALEHQEYHIRIEDDGGGIPSEKDLYELNLGRSIGSRGGLRGAKGSGLGLLIVHELVQRNKARLYFRNGEKGLLVELWFEASEVQA